MRKINLLLVLAVAGSIGGNASAMGDASAHLPHCTVSGADRLPAAVGGGDAICAAIRERANGSDFMVEVEVLSASSLAARIRLKDGRTLPQQKFAVSDRQLNPGSIKRFAAAIAAAVAGSGAH